MTTSSMMTTKLDNVDSLSKEAMDVIKDMFTSVCWTDDQIERGTEVRRAIESAMKTIIAHVPACPDRSSAIRKLREARMDCNSAITHNGKF